MFESVNTDFIEKLEGIVGLYLDPPEYTLVLYYQKNADSGT